MTACRRGLPSFLHQPIRSFLSRGSVVDTEIEQRNLGEAQAASNLAQGTAQAKVIEEHVAALKANPDYVKLEIARTWDGHLPAWTGSVPISACAFAAAITA